MNKKIEIMFNDMGVLLTSQIKEKLSLYANFLMEYNEHTNLTSIKNEEDIYIKHFYDSLTLIKAIDFNKYTSLLDIGSGAGFPGFVIKIFFSHLDVTLLDSNNKKTKFLNLLSEKLDIKVTIINSRAEDFAINNLNKYDVVTSRAVAYIDIISSLSIPFVKKEGKVLLMKGNLDNEITILNKHAKELNVANYSVLDVSYLNSIRNIIIIEKINETKKIMNYNQILKQSKKWQN